MVSSDTSIVSLLHGWECPHQKICKSTVRSLMEQPIQFSATPLSTYRDKYQACSSRVLQLSNSTEILPRVAPEREQKVASKNNIIECSEILHSSPVVQAGIDNRVPFFSRRIQWTPPSFQWHNPVSAWLSLCVRVSDYRWCPNIDISL